MVFENPEQVRIKLNVRIPLAESAEKDGVSGCLSVRGDDVSVDEECLRAALKISLAVSAAVNDGISVTASSAVYENVGTVFLLSACDQPIAAGGSLIIDGEDGEERTVRIESVSLKDDPGKLFYYLNAQKKPENADRNRLVLPACALTTAADLRTPKEVRRFLDKCRSIPDAAGVFDGLSENMLKADIFVSVRDGPFTEIRNVGSSRSAEKAAQYEIMRQKDVLRKGKDTAAEVRRFDEGRNVTVVSENAAVCAPLSGAVIRQVSVPLKESARLAAAALPELPDAKRARFIADYGLSDAMAKSLTANRAFADLFEAVAGETDPKAAAAWIDTIKGELNYRGLTGAAVRPEHVSRLIALVSEKKISTQGAVDILRTILDDGGDPDSIMASKSLSMLCEDDIIAAAKEAALENPAAVSDYRGGAEKALHFLVGKVMQKTKGKSDAKCVRDAVRKVLEEA